MFLEILEAKIRVTNLYLRKKIVFPVTSRVTEVYGDVTVLFFFFLLVFLYSSILLYPF